MHPPVVALSERRIDREASLVSKAVELRVAPVIEETLRSQQPPHHAVRVEQEVGGIGEPQSLERALPVLLRTHAHLDDLEAGIDPDVPPHADDGLAEPSHIDDVDAALQDDRL